MSEKNEWKPIESAPKTGRTLLLGYWNSHGKWRTVRGQWMSLEYIAEHWEDPDDAEAGWFETAVEADDAPNCWPVSPSHWQPMPAAPCQTCNGHGAVGNILTAEPCPDCSPAPSAPGDAQDERKPLFWYRPRSDDGYEGPIHNDRIEDVRKQSGAWVPLYPGFATLPKPLYDLRYHGEFIRGWNQCLREVSASVAAPAAGDALERQYTSAMGVAGQRYMDRFPYAHALPAGFRWEDLWNTMQNAASPASHTARDADVSTLLSFIFERFGQPGDAGELPDSVVAAVRRLERAALAAQVPQQDKGEA